MTEIIADIDAAWQELVDETSQEAIARLKYVNSRFAEAGHLLNLLDTNIMLAFRLGFGLGFYRGKTGRHANDS
jgi:hypothetical protein